jgi:DNA-directed RNA polymerase subunit K/omega
VVSCPDGIGKFEFAVIAALRAAQLSNGCTPRVAVGQNTASTAQREVAEGKVLAMPHSDSP